MKFYIFNKKMLEEDTSTSIQEGVKIHLNQGGSSIVSLFSDDSNRTYSHRILNLMFGWKTQDEKASFPYFLLMVERSQVSPYYNEFCISDEDGNLFEPKDFLTKNFLGKYEESKNTQKLEFNDRFGKELKHGDLVAFDWSTLKIYWDEKFKRFLFHDTFTDYVRYSSNYKDIGEFTSRLIKLN